MSTDSHDSGASHHGDLRQGHESKKPSSKLAESSFPTEKKKVRMSSGGSESKVKKKHKKCHKHHHCHKSHKHKRHRSGSAEMTSHKSSGAKRQYDESDHETLEQAGDHDFSDDSDQHNSSDEEVSHSRMLTETLFQQCGPLSLICHQVAINLEFVFSRFNSKHSSLD